MTLPLGSVGQDSEAPVLGTHSGSCSRIDKPCAAESAPAAVRALFSETYPPEVAAVRPAAAGRAVWLSVLLEPVWHLHGRQLAHRDSGATAAAAIAELRAASSGVLLRELERLELQRAAGLRHHRSHRAAGTAAPARHPFRRRVSEQKGRAALAPLRVYPDRPPALAGRQLPDEGPPRERGRGGWPCAFLKMVRVQTEFES